MISSPTSRTLTSTTPQSTTAAATRPFVVLCVCEGNICRSPVAAVLLRQVLGADVEVASAGTRAVVGAPVEPAMESLLRQRSPAGSGDFHARQLRPEHLRAADLVVTMTQRQRGKAAGLAPAVVRRTFTLRELARLLSEVGPEALAPGTVTERLRQAVPLAGARRHYVADPRDDDVADPYGRDRAAYVRAYDDIADAVDRVGEVLVGKS
ncbi:arsenate reductase/protein-tyrosine-phosphatase family protein [Microlunatus antarcticus]|uniref:Protein-tyrosine phosphatase n=1 Tax=Microlunatus antarcticus TaxID=53388 RepID=A0A7W5JXN6_9ACTN|nr:protein-tyrosine phosphatase [Microlunatus antarcticus]